MADKPHHEIYCFEGFKLNVTSAQLWYGETEIKLGPKERLILTHLVKNAGRLIRYKELFSVGWPEIRDPQLQEHYESEYPQQQIERINKKFRVHTNQPIISNITKEGYRFEPKISSADDESASDDLRVDTESLKSVGLVGELDPESAKTPEDAPETPAEYSEEEHSTESVAQSDLQGQEFNSGPAEVDSTTAQSSEDASENSRVTYTEPESTEDPFSEVTTVSGANDAHSSSRETVVNITGNEFSFLAYTAIGLLALVILGIVLAPQWDLNSRFAYIETSLICGGIAYNLRRVYRFWKADLINDRAHRGVQQFQVFWTLLLFSWLGLYGVFLVKSESHPLYVITTLLNNSNSLMLLLCYLVLNEPTISRRENSAALAENSLILKKSVIGGVIVLILGVLEELALFKFRAKYSNILLLSDLFSGTVGAIAMGLFISRLHSRLLGESTLLPIVGVILYLYVAIQPFYFILNQPAKNVATSLPAPWPMILGLSPWIIGLALMLKLIMFLYVTEIIRRNRLLFYMINAKRIYAEVEVQWREFPPR
jgi:DNA-binding winged helix-turn-helix (wHTH) protein